MTQTKDCQKQHGGDGGGLFTYNHNKGAKILFVLGRTGFLVDELGFVTDDAYVFGPHGGAGGGPFVSYHSPEGFLAYFEGSALGYKDHFLDNIVLWWQCPEGYEIEYRPQLWGNSTLIE